MCLIYRPYVSCHLSVLNKSTQMSTLRGTSLPDIMGKEGDNTLLAMYYIYFYYICSLYINEIHCIGCMHKINVFEDYI